MTHIEAAQIILLGKQVDNLKLVGYACFVIRSYTSWNVTYKAAAIKILENNQL
jgi:hypothetical protein